MLCRDADGYLIDAETVLRAYAMGCFPMSANRGGPLSWYRPTERAIITWDHVRCPRSLRKVMAREPYTIRCDVDFSAVVSACAARAETWIGYDIQALYEDLFARGFAHSVSAYDEQGRLVGGCYGLSVGRIFCGESMFHHSPDASKICVWNLMLSLRRQGFVALDCQQQSDHMQRFGARLISDEDYQDLLARYGGDSLRWCWDGERTVAS